MEGDWYSHVASLLRKRYARSRQARLISFLPSSKCFADAQVDGDGGSALLTELQRVVGAEVFIQRDVFKTLLLQCAQELGWPLQKLPSGAAMIGLRPARLRDVQCGLLLRAVAQLPLPPELRDRHLLPFLGETWWAVRSSGCESARHDGRHSYSASVPRPRKLLRAMLPFDCNALSFSFGHDSVVEWRGRSAISVHTADIWRFVHFVRYQRRGYRSELMVIGGLGDVLV